MEAFLEGTADGWHCPTFQFPVSSLLHNKTCHWNWSYLFLPPPSYFLNNVYGCFRRKMHNGLVCFLICLSTPSKTVLVLITESSHELKALQERLGISLVMLNILSWEIIYKFTGEVLWHKRRSFPNNSFWKNYFYHYMTQLQVRFQFVSMNRQNFMYNKVTDQNSPSNSPNKILVLTCFVLPRLIILKNLYLSLGCSMKQDKSSKEEFTSE